MKTGKRYTECAKLVDRSKLYSVEEGETITFLDLMRRGIQEKYQLGEKENE